MIDPIDKELLELAAQAAGIKGTYQHYEDSDDYVSCGIAPDGSPGRNWWNPLRSVEDRYELAQKLGLNIDFHNCTVFKVMPDNTVIQEYWGPAERALEDYAIVQVAADIAVYRKNNKLDFDI